VSAGGRLEDDDLDKLAPKFRNAVEAALLECYAQNLDAIVWEAMRSNELQALYYRRGRPPTLEYPRTVTNAATNDYSWHGYGLAVDVISKQHGWFNVTKGIVAGLVPGTEPYLRAVELRKAQGKRWFYAVAQVFKRHGCDWGGDWIQQDTPHFQWGRLKPSPSNLAREMLRTDGLPAIWRFVGAV
jgi:peptidoglycan LD-endopeptidase CwlK